MSPNELALLVFSLSIIFAFGGTLIYFVLGEMAKLFIGDN